MNSYFIYLIGFTLSTLFLGFLYESQIQLYIHESYSALTHLCALIFFAGISYGLIAKSILVVFMTMILTITLPWISYWFIEYWSYNPFFN